MNPEDPTPQKGSWFSWFKEVRRQVVIGLICTALTALLIWGFWYIEGRVTYKPVHGKLANSSRQTSIRPLFDILIRPAFAKYCSEPAWIKWFGRIFWSQECRRIVFDPHELADMQTRRVDFDESAEPLALMLLFVDRHKDCLAVELLGDTYKISEPTNSAVLRIRDQMICP